MSTLKYIVQHQDEQLGPFEEHELKTRWEAGTILGIDYVYDETKQDWVMLAECFRWAAAGHLDDTMPVKIQPPAMTEEIPLEVEIEAEAELPEAPPRAPAPAPKKPEHAAELRMVDGRGELSLGEFQPGHLSVKILHADLKSDVLHLDVRAAEPVRVRWSAPASHVVGHELELRFEAVDAEDRVCVGFAGEFTVVIGGGAQKRHDVKTIDGVGVVRWTHTKAEAWSLHLEHRGRSPLVLPAKHKLEWLAGPAQRLIVDGPTEYQAGSPLKVQVKAVDAYGNVARDFQGTVVLDVKAS